MRVCWVKCWATPATVMVMIGTSLARTADELAVAGVEGVDGPRGPARDDAQGTHAGRALPARGGGALPRHPELAGHVEVGRALVAGHGLGDEEHRARTARGHGGIAPPGAGREIGGDTRERLAHGRERAE